MVGIQDDHQGKRCLGNNRRSQHGILLLQTNAHWSTSFMLDGSIIPVAIPAITSQFDSLLDIGW
jgi:hypothetical protein